MLKKEHNHVKRTRALMVMAGTTIKGWGRGCTNDVRQNIKKMCFLRV